MKTTTAFESSAFNSSCNNQNNLTTTFSPHFQQPKLQSYQHQLQRPKQWNNFRVREKLKQIVFVCLKKKYWDNVGVSSCQFIVVEISSSGIWGHQDTCSCQTQKQGQIIILSHLLTACFFKLFNENHYRTFPTEQIYPQDLKVSQLMTWSWDIMPGLCIMTRYISLNFNISLNNLNKNIAGGGSVLQTPCPQEHKHRGWADVQETGQGPQESPLHPARGGHGVRGVSPVLKCARFQKKEGIFPNSEKLSFLRPPHWLI